MMATLCWIAVIACLASRLVALVSLSLAAPVLGWLRTLPPVARARWAFVIAALPAITMIATFVAVLAPSLLASNALIIDHC